VFRRVLGTSALAGLAALAACHRGEQQPGAAGEARPAPLVTVMTVRPAPLEATVEVVGTIDAKIVARLTAPGDGIVEALRVREGDAVREGQVVALVSSAERVALLGDTRSRADRLRERLADTALAIAARADVEHQLAEAEADYRYAGELLRPLPVVSPIAGMVMEKPAELGTVVSARTPLLTVADLSQLVVRATVSELLLASLPVGARVRVRVHAFPDDTLTGRITLVGPQVDAATRTAPLEVALSGKGGRLRPGMLVTVVVRTGRRDAALAVPDDAFLVRPDGARVLFVVQGDTVHRRAVQAGLSAGGRTEVVEGLRTGEEVVVEGHEGLRDGAPVRVRNRPAGAKAPAAAGGSAK